MRHFPTLPYTSLTVVLDKPSRFDNGGLICGNAGSWFDSSVVAGGCNRHSIEVRTLDSIAEPLLPNTKCLLLLGESSLHHFRPDLTLNESRGCPLQVELNGTSLTAIPTYTPQDCYDRYNYFSEEDSEKDEVDDSDEVKSTHGRTQRKNWRFWHRVDVKKAARVAQHGMTVGMPDYRLWPDLHDTLHTLTTTKGKFLYFDIETDSNLQMTCFGFAFGSQTVWVVPMLQTDRVVREYYYGVTGTSLLLRALAIAIRDNVAVIHNAMFDLFVLAWRYGIPLEGRVYDTMLAHTRCYIEVEKSLGHCISLYTDLPYHKNEGVFEPHNHQQTQQLYEYNGKDIYALTQIKPKIDETAARIGAIESVEQVNRMILPYLTMTLQGMNVDMAHVLDVVADGERYKIQIKRILDVLTNGLDLNPSSWQQVSRYLYENTFTNAETGRTFRIPKPKEDPTNEKTLLQLLLKHTIPAIYPILKYRQTRKRISKCKFRVYNGVYRGKDVTSSNTRFTTSYNLGRTTTMRLGSRKLLRRWGDNAQNFEEELRSIIVPDKGKILVQADQSGAEALIVAYLCRDGQYRDIFKCGINPHCFLGLHLFYEQFSAELGYDLKGYTQLPAKELVKESKWPEIGKCIKASDSWPIRYYFVAKQGNHCVDEQSEVLTPNGWKFVKDYINEEIAVFDKDTRDIKFEKPLAWNKFEYEGNMVELSGKMISQLVTPNHNVLYHCCHADSLQTTTAENLKKKGNIYIPTSGNYVGGSVKLPSCIASLIVATQADGHIYGAKYDLIRFRFKNKDKAERVRKLLNEASLYFEEKEYEGDCPFVFLVKGAKAITDYFYPNKVYGHWLLTFDTETLDTIINELKYWDGYEIIEHNHKRTQCSTAIQVNAEWLKTIIHLRNKQSSVCVDWFDHNPVYAVSINNRKFTVLHKHNRRDKQYKGMVYCPTTSTGYFVIRRRDDISITGNSLNYDARARMFRLNTLLKSEGSVAMSMEDAEKVIRTRSMLFPEIHSWHNEVVMEIRQKGIIRNLFGHPRLLTGHLDESQYKEYYAFPPQSTVGQITNYAITEIYEADIEGVDVLVNTHDGCVVQCYPEQRDMVGALLTRTFNRKLVSPRGEEFSMKSDLKWSETSWKEMISLKL